MRYQVRARNTSTSSENRIHDDVVARRYGFERGLVPGVDVYAYLTRPMLARWGVDWLRRGACTVQFVNPAYHGDELFVTSSSRPDRLDVYALTPQGRVCAWARARLPDDTGSGTDSGSGVDTDSGTDRPDPAGYPDTPPGAPLPATLAALSARPTLGAIGDVFDAELGLRYLDDVGDPVELYPRLRVAHPGWLLRWSNWILKRNVALGPWIHTASEVRNFALVGDRQRLQIRGRVADAHERKGQTSVLLDLVLLADGALVQHVRHSAIVQLLAT